MDSRTALAAAAASLQVACYNYEPMRRSALVPSAYLAVTLTPTGSDELARYLGPNVLVVRGRFLRMTERGLSLSVKSVEVSPGALLAWQGETVVVPQEFVWSVEQRRAARGKMALLAGASFLGVLIVSQLFGAGSSGTATGGTGSGPSPH
jgi:hypothetical protein